MRKTKTIALVLAVIMIAAALSACSVTNPNYTVLKVGDMDIGINAYYNYYSYLAQFYSMYGLYDVSTTKAFRSMQDQVFDYLVNNALPMVVAKQKGVTLTEEEEAQVQADYEEQLESMLSQYASQVDESITDEAEIRAEEEKLFKAELRESGWSYKKYLKMIEDDIRNAAIGNKYMETLYADITVTEEDAQKYYDDLLAEQEEEYALSPDEYFTDYTNKVNGNDAIGPLTTAEGYHYYKHILIKKSEDETDTSEVDAKIAEVQAKLDEGVSIEEFDELIAEYGEDPGMESDPYKTDGYMIHEAVVDDYYEGFGEAALALKHIGDVSDVVETEVGYHFIMYVGDVEVTTVPFEDVKDAIMEEVLEERKTATYNDSVATWKQEITITKYYDRVSSIK